MVPAGCTAELHEGEIAIVLELRGPHALIEVRGVAPLVFADIRDIDHPGRRIPFRSVVAAGFPWMHRDDDALTERIAHAREPLMPREEFREQSLQPRPIRRLVLGPTPERAHDAGSDWRLCDAGCGG